MFSLRIITAFINLFTTVIISLYNLKTFRYFVSMLMGADLSNILKIQRLNDEHIQFLVYQILRGLKVDFLCH